MAILEVKDLIRPVSRDDALADLIVLADAMGLRASSWRIGSVSRFYLMALAEMSARVSVQIALLSAAGFNSTSWGNALTKFSLSRFDNTRTAPIKTQGTALLTDAGGNGPYTIVAGAHVFTYDDDPAVTFRNITGGVLPASGTLEITIEAETGGEDANVDVDKITAMNPTIAGVTVNNPPDPTHWITRYGVSQEPDGTIQARNVSKWATLGGNAPRSAYDYWALSATVNADGTGDPVGLTRVFVDAANPFGPGTLAVYVADDSGTATGAQVTDVQEYIDARAPVTSLPTVIAASEVAVNIAGSCYVRAGYATMAATDVSAAINAYLNALPIGGTSLGGSGRVVFAELVAVAMAVDFVLSVSFTTPIADVALAQGEIAVVGTYTMTFVEV